MLLDVTVTFIELKIKHVVVKTNVIGLQEYKTVRAFLILPYMRMITSVNGLLSSTDTALGRQVFALIYISPVYRLDHKSSSK